MNYTVEKINENNYKLFDNMIFYRTHGCECAVQSGMISDSVIKELRNPNL